MTFRRFLGVVLFGAMAHAQGADGIGLEQGTLPLTWRSGGPNCVTVPDWQVHEYNEDFYILRESGCINYEKPFLYLIFGQERALLEDTGAGQAQAAPFVMSLIAKWAKKKNRVAVPLVVIHSHGHGDHTSGDKDFQAMASVQFVAATPEAIQKAAAIANWPAGIGSIDLGGRIVDVIPIPGHHTASIALYDRKTANLLTGDSLYPGRLYVPDGEVETYAASAQRLAAFATAHPIAHVLGTHIEQSRTAYLDYPRGTTYQPDEHSLELTRAHVMELNEAFQSLRGKPGIVVLPDFTVMPRQANNTRPAANPAKP